MLTRFPAFAFTSGVDNLESATFTIDEVVDRFQEYLESNSILTVLNETITEAMTSFVRPCFDSSLKYGNKRTASRTTIEENGTRKLVHSKVVVSGSIE